MKKLKKLKKIPPPEAVLVRMRNCNFDPDAGRFVRDLGEMLKKANSKPTLIKGFPVRIKI